MLSDNDLAYMEDSIEGLFPDTCYILSKTETVDTSGGVTATWGTVSTVACRTDFTNGVLQLAGGGVQPFAKMEICVPHDTTVTAANRVKWSGSDYAISSVNENSWLVAKVLIINALE